MSARRAKGFNVAGDEERELLATDQSKDVQDLLDLYAGSGVPAQTVMEARSAPVGDHSYLLRNRPS